MPIRITLDVELARRKMRLTDLAQEVGITLQNLSVLKTGRARAVRLDTLARICAALGCQPGDLLEYVGGSGATGPEARSRSVTAPEGSA